MGFVNANSEVLERLVTEMYARGLSTRDVEDAFRDATGDMLLSKSAVSQITDRLWEDYQAFISRDLSDISVEYLFVDAVFESLDRKSTRLNSSHANISYAVFCLKKKKSTIICSSSPVYY